MNFKISQLKAGIYLVGVPIGTARDITLRALDTLASAEILAAEDTRSLRRLLDIHGISLNGRKLLSLHDHSPPDRITNLIEHARKHAVAYASEAGMPLIADPGFELVRAAQGAGIYVTAAPGVSAVTTALSIAGLPTDAFFFAGFLPSAEGARRARLSAHAQIPATLVYFESPKRIGRMLSDASAILGEARQAVICRELTKKFEECRAGSLGALAQQVQTNPPKGEICVLIARNLEEISEIDVTSELKDALERMSMRDAVDMVSKAHDLPRRSVYQAALELSKAE